MRMRRVKFTTSLTVLCSQSSLDSTVDQLMATLNHSHAWTVILFVNSRTTHSKSIEIT
ncbi:hypothetical protein HOLleu_29101 [Holothuria leucospilota]|uniref:Uncharacterized protein n=1 Tax=Holothuria leucospilota TaxID=206669 RepID=A0A9Q1H200_HOLLE|nr:hypothetical protein HOLleu_29101 [Holothuria leucospilota]